MISSQVSLAMQIAPPIDQVMARGGHDECGESHHGSIAISASVAKLSGVLNSTYSPGRKTFLAGEHKR